MKRGELPFSIVDERGAAKFARDYEHIVIDTEARPNEDDLRSLAEGCDLLVIPTTPDAMAIDALLLTVEALRKIKAANYNPFDGRSAQTKPRRRRGATNAECQ